MTQNPTERTVDCHIALHDKPEASGERMLAAATLVMPGRTSE